MAEIKIQVNKIIEKANKQFQRLEKRQRTLALLLIAAVLFSFYYNIIYKPQSGALRRLRAESVEASNRLTKLKSQLPDTEKEKEGLNTAKKALDFLKAQLASLETQLPSQGRIPQLLGELVRQASGYSIDFLSIRPKTAKAKKEYAELLIELKLNADYTDLVNYLNRLESLSPFLRATDITLDEMKEGLSGGAEATITLATLLGEAGEEQKEEAVREPAFASPLTIQRNPFLSNFKPGKREEKKEELRLSGVIAAGGQPTAIINNEVYRLGDEIGNKKVKQILPNMVMLSDGREDTVLTLD